MIDAISNIYHILRNPRNVMHPYFREIYPIFTKLSPPEAPNFSHLKLHNHQLAQNIEIFATLGNFIHNSQKRTFLHVADK